MLNDHDFSSSLYQKLENDDDGFWFKMIAYQNAFFFRIYLIFGSLREEQAFVFLERWHSRWRHLPRKYFFKKF